MQQQGQITDDGSVTFPDKVQMSIERLRHFEPPEGYYLAFSGGKDSIVIYDLAVKAGVKFDAHYNLTTVDPPELVKFIRQEYPEVARHRPEMNMFQWIVKKRMPPTRLVRYCCEKLKEGGGNNRRVVTGIRWAESSKRAGRRMVENCNKKSKNSTFLHPIIDWTDTEIWEYIRAQQIPYCHLYDEGFKRLGCIMCPMQGTKGMLKDAERWPRYYNLYMKAFEKMIEVRKSTGDWNPISYNTAEEVMYWWIHKPPKGDPDQGVLFE